MLTYVEVPGIYVNKTTGLVAALDSLGCGITEENDQRKLWVKAHRHDTTVTVLIDDREDLGAVYFGKMENCP